MPKTDIPYDLLICLGDIGWSDWQRLFSYPQFKNIPYKIGVVGNHDSNDFSEINQWLQESNVTPIVDLHNTAYTLPDYNFTFAGIKASVKYKMIVIYLRKNEHMIFQNKCPKQIF